MITPHQPPSENLPGTLEELTRYKIELKRAVKEQQAVLGETFRGFRSPVEGIRSVSRLAGTFTRGLTLFEGALFGWKLIKMLRKFLRK